MADEITPRSRLHGAVSASTLSVRQFARCVLSRDERKVRRWMEGTEPIPPAVAEFLEMLSDVTVTGNTLTITLHADPRATLQPVAL